MRVLCVNAGSSSIKFSLYEMPSENLICMCKIENIALKTSGYSFSFGNLNISKEQKISSHEDGVKLFLSLLNNYSIVKDIKEIKYVGHRVVHGGNLYFDSQIVTKKDIKKLEKFNYLAPLHNPKNVECIKIFMKLNPSSINIILVDTAFHSTIKEEMFMYPVPYEWYKKYHVRKYGFHGLNYRYIVLCMKKILGTKTKMIVAHLGSGASLCAIKNGKSIDTSMGLSPLDGIMMGTRTGNIDARIISHVVKLSNKSYIDVINILNNSSGLEGVSGISSDMREIEKNYKKKDKRALLAVNMYVQKIVNYISMYNTLLEKTDALIFTAGIGERFPFIRKLIIDKLNCLGFEIDNSKNNNVNKNIMLISSKKSKVKIYVVKANEEIIIAKDTYNIVKNM